MKGFKRLKLIFDRKQQFNWYIRPFDICLNQERLVGRIRAGGICVRVGEALKYIKRGWNRTERKRRKDFENWANWVKQWVP